MTPSSHFGNVRISNSYFSDIMTSNSHFDKVMTNNNHHGRAKCRVCRKKMIQFYF